MTEVLFYHLERQRMEDVLPMLLLKTLERGWRAVVQCGQKDKLADLSTHLWQWRDDAFLAHGTADDGFAEHQPIWLTAGDDAPNGANVRILVDGADCEDATGLERLVVMFDGGDEAAVSAARAKWKQVCAQTGMQATYWQQDGGGRWVKKAEGGTAAAEPNNEEGGDV